MTQPLLTAGSLFAGCGGLTLAVGAAFGAAPAWFSEYEPPSKAVPRPTQAAARVLAARFPGVPNHGDITRISWDHVADVDIIDGGSPCQDLSAAGAGAGMRTGTRSGLWASMCAAIAAKRPRLVIWENVRGSTSSPADSNVEPCPICVGDERETHLRALGRVLGDLSDLGYDAVWEVVPASAVGAPHRRDRVFVLAWPAGDPPHLGRQRIGPARGWRPGPAHASPTVVPDTSGLGRVQGWPEPSWLDRGHDVALGGDAAAHTDDVRHAIAGTGGWAPQIAATAGSGEIATGGDGLEWGEYGPAIERWEHVLGRPAPSPTQTSPRGARQLAPAFVEWLMGLPGGWVTGVDGLTRTEQLRILGNGVVPAQGAHALARLAARIPVSADSGVVLRPDA